MQSLALSWLSSGMIVQLEAKILLLGLQDEERKALFPIKQKGNLPPTHGPVFLATATVWDKLKRTAEHDVDIASDSFKVAERHVGKLWTAAPSGTGFLFLLTTDMGMRILDRCGLTGQMLYPRKPPM